MEEHFDALEGLFQFGSCVYTTSYREHNFSVTIRNVTGLEQFYNYVFRTEDLRSNIYLMLDGYLEDKECDTFSAAMLETLPNIELPMAQLPVVQVNSLKIEVRALRKSDCYRAPVHEVVRFHNFKA